MLDLNHPQTKFVFAIARADDALLSIAKQMTLVDNPTKQLLLPRAHEAILMMRDCCLEGWGKKQKKLDAIDLLHKRITEFAVIPSTNDYVTDWRGKNCTICESPITNLEKYDDMLYCPKCLDLIADGRRAVYAAFGLWCI